MVWVIVNVFFLLFVGILMILNAGNPAELNFFGLINKDITTVGVLIVGFLSGTVYSFAMYLVHHFRKVGISIFRRKKEKVKQLETDVKEKEKEVTQKEKDLEKLEKNYVEPEFEGSNAPTAELPAAPVKRKTSTAARKKKPG